MMIARLFEKPKLKGDQEPFIRKLVSLYSKGNASVKQGWYITAEDIQTQKKGILSKPLID